MKLLSSVIALGALIIANQAPACAEIVYESFSVQPAFVINSGLPGKTLITTPLREIPRTGFVVSDGIYKPGIHVPGRYSGGSSNSIAGTTNSVRIWY
jgi:hypothetical protein